MCPHSGMASAEDTLPPGYITADDAADAPPKASSSAAGERRSVDRASEVGSTARVDCVLSDGTPEPEDDLVAPPPVATAGRGSQLGGCGGSAQPNMTPGAVALIRKSAVSMKTTPVELELHLSTNVPTPPMRFAQLTPVGENDQGLAAPAFPVTRSTRGYRSAVAERGPAQPDAAVPVPSNGSGHLPIPLPSPATSSLSGSSSTSKSKKKKRGFCPHRMPARLCKTCSVALSTPDGESDVASRSSRSASQSSDARIAAQAEVFTAPLISVHNHVTGLHARVKYNVTPDTTVKELKEVMAMEFLAPMSPSKENNKKKKREARPKGHIVVRAAEGVVLAIDDATPLRHIPNTAIWSYAIKQEEKKEDGGCCIIS